MGNVTKLLVIRTSGNRYCLQLNTCKNKRAHWGYISKHIRLFNIIKKLLSATEIANSPNQQITTEVSRNPNWSWLVGSRSLLVVRSSVSDTVLAGETTIKVVKLRKQEVNYQHLRPEQEGILYWMKNGRQN